MSTILHRLADDKTLITPRGRLAAPEIAQIIAGGVVEDADPQFINSASLDLRLGRRFLVEWGGDIASEDFPMEAVTLDKDTSSRSFGPSMTEVFDEIVLAPGQRCLAQTLETFNLPNTISAEVRVRSTAARRGLDHAFASWCDAGWHGSVLTLEFVNLNRFHSIRLRAGDRAVQMIFEAHTDAGEHSYALKGRYNNSSSVEEGK